LWEQSDFPAGTLCERGGKPVNFDDPITSFWHDWIYSALFLSAALGIIAYTNWEKRQAERKGRRMRMRTKRTRKQRTSKRQRLERLTLKEQGAVLFNVTKLSSPGPNTRGRATGSFSLEVGKD